MRKLGCELVPLIVVSLFSPDASGQSVVQLPSFETFSYSGSVMVPDSGTASLGGVRRTASNSSRSGLSRSHSASRSHPHASVSANIIDLAEIDREILGGTPQQFLQAQLRAEAAKNAVARKPADPDAEGKALVRYARRRLIAGDHSAALDGYVMAINRLSPRLRELARQEFRHIFGVAADQSLRMSALRR